MTTKTRELELIAPPPAPEPDAVTLARAEVEKLYMMETSHADRGMQARKDEQDLSSSAGVLDLASFESASTVDLARRLSEIHAIALLADRAVELCRQKRREAITAFYQAQAAQARERAAQAQAEADTHGAALREALAAVEALENCTYVPDRTPVDGGYAGYPAIIAMPKSTHLAMEVEKFTTQARAADRLEVVDRGSVESEASEAAVLDALASAYGAFQIAPTAAMVRAWLSTMRGAQRVQLVWKGGAIDAAKSRGWRAEDV